MPANQESFRFGAFAGPGGVNPILAEVDRRNKAIKEEKYDEQGWRAAVAPKGAAPDWLKQQEADWTKAFQDSGVKPHELKAGQYFGDFGVFDANTKNSLPPDYSAVSYSKGVLRNPYVEAVPRDYGVGRPTAYSQTEGQHYSYRQGYQKLGPQSDLIIARRTGSFSDPNATPQAPAEFKPSPELEKARSEARTRGTEYLNNQSSGQGQSTGSGSSASPSINFTGDLYKDAALISADAAKYTPRFQDFISGMMRDARLASLEVSEGTNHLIRQLGQNKSIQPSQARDPFTDPITINPRSLYALTQKDIKNAAS